MPESRVRGRIRRSVLLVAASVMVALATTASCTRAERSPPTSVRPQKISYGPSPQQFGFLSIPHQVRASESLPVVVLVHGGFWSNRVGVDVMAPLADDLVGRGYVVWNLEYRRLGDEGGGFPGTLDDVADGIDHLALLAESTEADLDLDQVAVLGHSAGGHLALLSAGRNDRADTAVTVGVTVGLAAVSDLVAAVDAGVGANAIVELLGGTPSEQPDRYTAAQPAAPTAGTVILVHGEDDTVVPVSQTQQSSARLNAQAVVLSETDHFDLIDPGHPAWREVLAFLGT